MRYRPPRTARHIRPALKMGVGLGRGGAPSWSPNQLPAFLGGLDIAASLAAGKLWQNAGKTVAATSDTDPVRVATCHYSGVDFTAPSDAARPLLKITGSKSYLLFDGTDDEMSSNLGHTWTALAHGVGVAVQPGADVDYDPPVIAETGTGGWRLCTQIPGGKWGTYGAVDIPANTTLSNGTDYTLVMNGGNFRLDGAADGTYAASIGYGAVGTNVKIATDNFRWYIGRIYGAVFSSASLSAGNLTLLETYLDGLMP